MNSTQALTKLRKLIGPTAAIQDNKRPSSPEQRQRDRDARLAANERRKVCETAMDLRRRAILDADTEYQRLKREYEQAKAEQRQTAIGSHYRYSAGRVTNVAGLSMFSVTAEADTLDELTEKAAESRK